MKAYALAIFYGGCLILAALAVFYCIGIFVDRWIHDFMTDEEYRRSLRNPFIDRVLAGATGLALVGVVLVLMWLVGAPLSGALP